MIPLNAWACTDPNTNQYGRKIGEGQYEFKQDVRYPDGTVSMRKKRLIFKTTRSSK